MTTKKFELVALIALGLSFAGCSRTHSELGGDSSTHWLLSCRDDAQCGGLSCVCGVCSKECDRDKQCGALGARASCVQSPDGCGELQLCDYQCTNTRDCVGEDVVCLDGRCRRSAPVEPGGVDERDGGSASQADAAELMSLVDAGEQLDAASEAGSPQLDAASEAGRAGSATSCAPQRAASNGTECLRLLGFSWNGAACEEVNCGCEGPDCAAIFSSKAACETAYATCLNPETQCSGLPWYRCFDHCPGDLQVIGGSRSLGECSGDCSFFLNIMPPAAGSGSCLSVPGELRINNSVSPPRTAFFELSDRALEELTLLSRAVAGPAPAVLPCTDCPLDVGSASITRPDPGDPSGLEVISYPSIRPPLELRAVHQFMQSLIDQASVCRGDKLKSCRVDRLINSLPLPACGEKQRFAEGTCTCPVGLEQLSTLDGMPCSEPCPYCSVPNSTCGAICTQPCAGGTTYWDVSCTQ